CDKAVVGTRMYGSHVIFSDDHGASWKLGGIVGDYTNECQAAELADGNVLINMRSYHGQNRRAVATSRDGGVSWSEVILDRALVEPVCQASLLRYPSGKRPLLFSNPASMQREKLTARASFDDWKTWAAAKGPHAGPAAFSCLTVPPGGRGGWLLEGGGASPDEAITFARVSLGWLAGDRLGGMCVAVLPCG